MRVQQARLGYLGFTPAISDSAYADNPSKIPAAGLFPPAHGASSMIDPAGIVSILFDHKIAVAERLRPDAAKMRTMTAADILDIEAKLADLYDRRRIALEEMMRAPFQAARDHA